MAKLTPSQVAQKLALQGNPEAAMAELFSIQQRGDIGACASLAEIAAFKGQWAEVLKYAQVVAQAPSSVWTRNVYIDMVNLLALTGIQLGNWIEVGVIADLSLAKLKQPESIDEDKVGPVASVQQLARFAATKGQTNYVWRLATQYMESLEKRKRYFESALDEVANDKKKRFKTPQERVNYLFSLASAYHHYEGAVTLYDHEEPQLLSKFNNVMFAASALARCGRIEEAWQSIRSKLHLWWPVEVTQIAPVELLTDEGLRPLMTPERCDEVLRTPRGAEAKVK